MTIIRRTSNFDINNIYKDKVALSKVSVNIDGSIEDVT